MYIILSVVIRVVENGVGFFLSYYCTLVRFGGLMPVHTRSELTEVNGCKYIGPVSSVKLNEHVDLD